MVLSFRQRIKIGWAVVGAFAVMALGATTAFGESPPAPEANGVYPTPAGFQHAQYVVNLLDPYVVRVGDGTLALNPPASVSNRVGSAMMNQVRSGLAVVNGEIRAGRLVATENHRIYDPTASDLNVQAGWTGIRWYWWGVQIFLDEVTTQNFLGALASGVAIFSLCMVIPALGNATACGILAAMIALFAAVIMMTDRGSGVIFTHFWWGYPDTISAQ